jgi:DNA-binding LacI/PurR family transcriptional regulator
VRDSSLPAARHPRRPPGMVDVARAAGVSQKTVSRVINNEPYVRPHVRERVLEVVQSLGYRRNSAARALISGRSHRIGVVSLGAALYGPASVLIALQRAAESAGYSLAIATTREGETQAVQRAIDGLLEQGVEGIVLSEPIDEGAGSEVHCPVPVASLGRMPGLRGDDLIVTGVEGREAGRIATEHLLSLGHETVWHVAGPRAWNASGDRLAGWREALEAHGAPQPPVLLGDWSPASGYAAGQTLAARADVTAIFVANDDMAIGVLRALVDAGRDVPSDVSVVGFDDIPAADYLRPRLTTIRQDFDALAWTGLDLLVRRLEQQPDPRDTRPVVHQLIVRESTGPAPSRSHGDRYPDSSATEKNSTGDNRRCAAGRRPKWSEQPRHD